MHAVLGWLGSLGAAIVYIAILLATYGGAAAAGFYAAKRTNNNWIGWAVGIAAFVLLIAIFGPINEAAKRIGRMGAGRDALADLHDIRERAKTGRLS
jgi:hypothetical protein